MQFRKSKKALRNSDRKCPKVDYHEKPVSGFA